MPSSRQQKKQRREARKQQQAEIRTRQAQEESAPTINVQAARWLKIILVTCILAELLFVFLDATVNYARWTEYGMIRRLCNIAREDGLASWFGTTQTWMVGLTLGLIYLVARRDGRSRYVRMGWAILAAFFLYMAADDGAEIHERMGSAFKKKHTEYAATPAADTLGEKALDFFPSYSWQIVFMPLFGAMGLFMLIFLWRQLGSRSARAMLVTALVLLSIGVALDFVEGLDEGHPWNAYTLLAERFDLFEFTQSHFGRRPYDALRHFSKSIEEFLEMFSTTLLWYVFLRHFMQQADHLKLRFTGLSENDSDSQAPNIP